MNEQVFEKREPQLKHLFRFYRIEPMEKIKILSEKEEHDPLHLLVEECGIPLILSRIYPQVHPPCAIPPQTDLDCHHSSHRVSNAKATCLTEAGSLRRCSYSIVSAPLCLSSIHFGMLQQLWSG